MIAWEFLLFSVLCISAGIFTSLPYLPCIWLGLGRATSEQRLFTLLGLLCALAVILSVDGVAFAVHLLVTTLVLLGWRCVFYERPRYSLSFLFAATSLLAVFLALAVPFMKTWQPPGNFRWMNVLVSLAAIVPAPVLLAWASVALQRRIWAVALYGIALIAFFQWWLFDGVTWAGAWFTLMFQTGYALTIVVVVRTVLRHDLVIWPKPKNPREPLPRRLPWIEPAAGESAGEA